MGYRWAMVHPKNGREGDHNIFAHPIIQTGLVNFKLLTHNFAALLTNQNRNFP